MLSIGKQLTEHVRLHEGVARQAAERARGRAARARCASPIRSGRSSAFPHQFSGGMRQRIAIAIALACGPKLLIADEPTTALDVTVQAGILRLLDRLRRENGLSVILITHDLGVMSSIADRVSVFYAGRIVESGTRRRAALARRATRTRARCSTRCRTRKQKAAPSSSRSRARPPTPRGRPPGCAFHPRCALRRGAVPHRRAAARAVGDGRLLACPPDPFAPAP